MMYYDGEAVASVNYMIIRANGIDSYIMGGVTRTSGNATPVTGSWKQDDYVQNNAPAISGTAGSKYVVKGWIRITTGSGNIFNTDWVDDRSLTGFNYRIIKYNELLTVENLTDF